MKLFTSRVERVNESKREMQLWSSPAGGGVDAFVKQMDLNNKINARREEDGTEFMCVFHA